MTGAGRGLVSVLCAVAVVAVLAVAMPLAAAQDQAEILTCTNPVSGARWVISVDFAQKTADSWPAAITSRWITWHNGKDQGFYSLQRASGELTITRASSTGGYEQHVSCRPG